MLKWNNYEIKAYVSYTVNMFFCISEYNNMFICYWNKSQWKTLWKKRHKNILKCILKRKIIKKILLKNNFYPTIMIYCIYAFCPRLKNSKFKNCAKTFLFTSTFLALEIRKVNYKLQSGIFVLIIRFRGFMMTDCRLLWNDRYAPG